MYKIIAPVPFAIIAYVFRDGLYVRLESAPVWHSWVFAFGMIGMSMTLLMLAVGIKSGPRVFKGTAISIAILFLAVSLVLSVGPYFAG